MAITTTQSWSTMEKWPNSPRVPTVRAKAPTRKLVRLDTAWADIVSAALVSIDRGKRVGASTVIAFTGEGWADRRYRAGWATVPSQRRRSETSGYSRAERTSEAARRSAA